MNELQVAKLLERIDQLEEKVETLEAYQAYRRNFLKLNDGEVVFKTKNDAARLVMKNNGSIHLVGMDIEIQGSGKVRVKGSTISEN